MTLSVVIPTTATRDSIFKTIESVHTEASEFDFKIEVVVNSFDSDEKIIERLSHDARIELRFQSQIRETAEASAFWAAYTSDSDWIWILGDDDLATSESVKHVVSLIKLNTADFWLLNVLLLYNRVPQEYYRIGPEPIQTCSATKLWERCGFFSVTTTLSCFLVKRSCIDIELFEEFHQVQGIYSHSFSLLAMLKDSRVGATDFFCVLRNEESSENIKDSLTRYTSLRGVEYDSLWSSGATALFELLAQKIDVPVSNLCKYREIELVKGIPKSRLVDTNLQILISNSLSVMDRFMGNGVSYKSQHQTLVFDAPVRVTL